MSKTHQLAVCRQVNNDGRVGEHHLQQTPLITHIAPVDLADNNQVELLLLAVQPHEPPGGLPPPQGRQARLTPVLGQSFCLYRITVQSTR